MARRLRPRLVYHLASMILLSAAAMASRAEIVSYDAGLGTLPPAQGWPLFQDGPQGPDPTVSGGLLHQGPSTVEGRQFWENYSLPMNFITSSATLDATLRIIFSDFGIYSGVPRTGYFFQLVDGAEHSILLGLAS